MARKDIKQINDIRDWQKKNGGKRLCLKRIKSYDTGNLLLGNDKNNGVAEKVFSYFESLSSKFEVYVARLATK